MVDFAKTSIIGSTSQRFICPLYVTVAATSSHSLSSWSPDSLNAIRDRLNLYQVKLNKASVADTASLLFQTDFSGRAEMGTAGQDDFAIKVSADGSSWTTALAFDAASGMATGAALTQSVGDATVGRLLRVGDFGIGADAGPLVADLDAHALSGSFSAYGGAHAQAPAGANPFSALDGVFGLLCGNSTLGGQSANL